MDNRFARAALAALSLALGQIAWAQPNDAPNNDYLICTAQRQARLAQLGVRGAGPYGDLYVGACLPEQYRNRSYVVDNWLAHKLKAPPPGQQWMQAGADYVLVNVGNGLITQILGVKQ